MAKKKSADIKKITNRRAKFDYEFKDDSFLAGIVLTGIETKSLRLGHGHLRGAYVTIKDDEVYLFNATITGFSGAKLEDSQQTRSRKLLLKKREIDQIIEAKNQDKSVIPLELITTGRYIKIRISIGTGRKKYDKREVIKKRDQERNTRRELRNH
jgi:SsrA-binding protein